MNIVADLSTFPSIDLTPSPMSQFRIKHPKPPLFDLIHKWNLSEDQINSLDLYKYKEMCGVSLKDKLNKDKGRIKQFWPIVGLTITYVPIYMNCTRQDINHYRYGDRYHLSFRSTKCGQHIVLIQPVERD